MLVLGVWFALALTATLASAQEQASYGQNGYSGINSELEKLDGLLRFGKAGMYDRRQTPGAAVGSATQVHIQMYIRSFGSINPMQMDYTVDLYLRQRWLEMRFLNNTLTRPLDVSDPILVKILWKPEVYFPNAKESDFQYVTVPNVMLRIHPDGTILYILRLKLTFSCMMDLSSFPLDHQTCFMEVASFVKTTRELELDWYANNPIKIYEKLKLPQFEMMDIKAETCGLTLHIGNYSCLKAVFELRRNVGYHLVQSYLPTSLIVVVSWVSFWLDVDAIPSRVTLGVTTLLTVCSESTSFRDKMPTVSYVKALDIWMGSCTAFVFLALVEFTVVTHLARHHRRFLFWEASYVRQVLCGGILSTTAAAIFKDGEAPKLPPYSNPFGGNSSPGPSSSKGFSSVPYRREGEGGVGGGGNTSKVSPSESDEKSIKGSPYFVHRSHLEPVPDDSIKTISLVAMDSRTTSTVPTTHQTPHKEETTFDLRVNEASGGWGDCTCGGSGGGDCECTSGHSSDITSDQNLEKMTPLLKRWGEEAILAKNIDKLSRLMFPSMFFLFNVAYWGYYKVIA